MSLRLVATVSLLALLATSGPGVAADRLNVLVIVCDDLGGADLGCYGSQFHRTPHLDQLAKNSLRFTTAYASCPVCSPSRAALMTGQYPARLHLTDWLPGRPDRPDQKLLRPAFRQQLPLEETTLAEVLKKAGYATGHIGKWHLGGEGFEPQKQGFDSNIAGDHTGTPWSYFAPFKRRDSRTGRERTMPGLEKAEPGEYLTDRLTAEAEKFVQRHKDRPFFLYLAHYAPHIPLRAPADLIAKYPQKMIPGKQSNPIYAAMLESIDTGIGRLLRTLEDCKLGDRTLVIFTSDNGGLATLEGPNTPATINTPFREGKGYLYEGGIRVPLLIKLPGCKPGTSSIPVAGHDLFPTILAACGIKHTEAVDGVSLLPILKGEGTPRREALFWHYPHYSNQGGQPGGAVREGDWKLIEFYENNRRELYDLKADPSESRNRAGDKPEVVQRLAAKLAQWRKDVKAQMPRPNPDFVPNPQASDGTITLPARTAEVHGLQLRYEPLPHKNTLGFWSRAEDFARWEFTVSRPGTFTLEALQCCGRGQGGSVVEFSLASQTLTMTVEDTGGWQNFKARAVGTVKLDKPGRYQLTVKPRSKAGTAVMDLRQLVLRPKG